MKSGPVVYQHHLSSRRNESQGMMKSDQNAERLSVPVTSAAELTALTLLKSNVTTLTSLQLKRTALPVTGRGKSLVESLHELILPCYHFCWRTEII